MSNEKRVTQDTPPAFLVHGGNDPAVPVENSLMFAEALRQAGVGFELHVFEKSPGHGFGLGQTDPAVSAWPRLCEHWLRAHGF
jgi:acetyl esterase/lipase